MAGCSTRGPARPAIVRAAERARLRARARPGHGSRVGRARLGLVAAVLLPAVLAGGAVLAFTAGSQEAPGGGAGGSPAQLAALADLGRRPSATGNSSDAFDARAAAVPLRPLLAEPGRAGLEPSPLEPVEGGIRPAPPERIAIPAAGVDTSVEPVRARGGAIEVPDLGNAGWYDGGPRPGERGRAVVIGHLDARRGPGLFARVPRLPPGTLVAVTDRRGEVHRFNVIGGAQVRKDRFPAKYLFGASDAPVLVLITCGGPFRPGSGYRDNVLLYAQAA